MHLSTLVQLFSALGLARTTFAATAAEWRGRSMYQFVKFPVNVPTVISTYLL
jgi:hypothetical protein